MKTSTKKFITANFALATTLALLAGCVSHSYDKGAATSTALSSTASAVALVSTNVNGVLAAMTPDGLPDAAALSGALAGKGKATLAYLVFDLPYLDGHDLARVPLAARKKLLAELVRASSEPGPLRFLDHVAGDGAAFQREAGRLGIAAMVSRRAGSPYGARAGWVRAPCTVSAKR